MLPWWWIPQRMMSNSVPECEKDNLTGCVSFYTQWIDICVCIRVRGLHLVFFLGTQSVRLTSNVRGIGARLEQNSMG